MLVAALVAAAGWLLVRRAFATPRLARTNVRGIEVPTGAGFVAAVAAIADTVARFATEDDTTFGAIGTASGGWVLVIGGFALLGLLDDVVGTHEFKGFRGHLRALRSGRVTTGLVKLVGGGIVALVAVGTTCNSSLLHTVLGGAVVALGANTANLFDRAPGRTTKVSILALALLWLGVPEARQLGGVGAPAMVGAAVGLLWFDLREELMLGDAGANPLGAALGFGAALTLSTPVLAGVAIGLVACNLAGERVSFSRVIAANPVLARLDGLGRRPLEGPPHPS